MFSFNVHTSKRKRTEITKKVYSFQPCYIEHQSTFIVYTMNFVRFSFSQQINRDDDKLFDAIVDFAHCHDTVYLTVGMIIGRNMYKEMEEITK